MVELGPGVGDGRRVTDHADSAVQLRQITSYKREQETRTSMIT